MRGWVAALAMIGWTMSGAAAGSAPAGQQRWTATWGSAQMVADGENALRLDAPDGVTLRQVVHVSAGGKMLRVQLSNAFGADPVTIGAASVGRVDRSGSTVLADGAATLRFDGKPGVVIPAGGARFSDSVAVPLAPGADLAISLYLPRLTHPQTGHPGARATTQVATGNHVADREIAAAETIERWYVISAVDVATDHGATIVAIGDSITDGHGVGTDSNARWTDILAQRLRNGLASESIGIVNAGIGGNRMLRDGLGPNLIARFDRDVLARSGARWAILLEGVNDLGMLTRDAPATQERHREMVASITNAYRGLVAKAHANGIRVIGGTVMPFVGNDYYHPGPASEADRQAINRFIRTAGVFDAVVDFDEVMRDPDRPDRLAPAFDSGDHLHPSEAGYRRMGEAVPLSLFVVDTAVEASDRRPAIALTFDDIPAHGPLPPGTSRADIIRNITAALLAAKAPAFGFYNAGFGHDDPSAAKAVDLWRDAGFPLGNHSYSHANLADVGADAFAADIVRDEPPLAMAAGADTDWHWFRYPFLSEGTSAATRDTVRAMLRQRGYRIAAVTMSFDDYNWNAPYAACAAKRDERAIRQLERTYLSDAREAALAARRASQSALGRDIPYVLLMHVGAFDAHMLPALLDLYATMGFRFVSLPMAEADPFYARAIDLTRSGPTPSLPGATLSGPPANLCR